MMVTLFVPMSMHGNSGFLPANYSIAQRTAVVIPQAVDSVLWTAGPTSTLTTLTISVCAALLSNSVSEERQGSVMGNNQAPDGRHVRATVRYAVVGQKDLPLSGNHIGDARYVAGDKHWYVWLIQSANSAPAWIDPWTQTTNDLS
jgi:hypothetical protein